MTVRHMKVLEHYSSVQGEGNRVGELTQFVRFAGCNLRCPGWPCDTQHAIQPGLYIGKYANQTPQMLSEAIKDRYDKTGARNVCFTGGEPFMQPVDCIHDVVHHLHPYGFDFEVFTNGTYLIPQWFVEHHGIMMDWKLPGSGEHFDGAQAKARLNNAERLMPWHGIKFVCKDSEDLRWAITTGALLRSKHQVKATFWLGVAFGELTEADAVKYMMENQLIDWRLNVQVHKYIWDPEKQGV